MSYRRFLFLTGLILIAALSRLLPHAPNATPLAALALFGGAKFSSRKDAFLVTFGALLLSDLLIGFHSQVWSVYLSFGIVILAGERLKNREHPWAIAVTGLLSAVIFFVITNFGVWLLDGLYPRTVSGLMECFAAAIPFFRNSLAADAFYLVTLFGLCFAAERKFVSLRPASVITAR